MKKTLILLACVAATAGSAAMARDLPSCNRSCSPEEWASLSLQEKADMWPALSRDSRHRIWSFMTDPEKQALRDKLRPIQRDREKLRRRYDCIVSDGRYSKAAVSDELTPNERQHLRQQILEVHLEFQQQGGIAPGRSAAFSHN